MNKFLRMGAAGAVIAAAVASGSVAHAAANASATASVEVLRPLQIAKVDDMYFGAVAVNGVGTVSLATNGTASCTANLVCTGTPVLAEFRVYNGTPNKQVTIDLPANIVLQRTGGTTIAADTVELSNYVTDATENADGTHSILLSDNAAAEANFQLGGTLSFDGSEVAGTYEGTIHLSVEYS